MQANHCLHDNPCPVIWTQEKNLRNFNEKDDVVPMSAEGSKKRWQKYWVSKFLLRRRTTTTIWTEMWLFNPPRLGNIFLKKKVCWVAQKSFWNPIKIPRPGLSIKQVPRLKMIKKIGKLINQLTRWKLGWSKLL